MPGPELTAHICDLTQSPQQCYKVGDVTVPTVQMKKQGKTKDPAQAT